MTFTLNCTIDWSHAAKAYAEDGVARIPAFLAPGHAELLAAELQKRDDWRQVVNSGDKVFDLTRAQRDALDPVQRQRLDDAVYAGARYGFQYRFESIRVPDEAAARARVRDPISGWVQFLSSEPVLHRLREVCAAPELSFADAQATAYAPGDFLTGHDDDIAGKDRRTAYILSLSPDWRPEWGGLLLLHDAPSDALRALAPKFGMLTLLRVPQMHSVSEVTKAAPRRRYSITGWLRAGPVP